MPAATPRLRLFAGPNGSGKSTIKELLPSDWLGVYVNADDIEKRLRQEGSISLSEFEIELTQQDWMAFVRTSTLLAKAGLVEEAFRWRVGAGVVEIGGGSVNSYLASALADFLRRRLLASGISFTFESVMSSRDKVEFLAEARTAGFRTYLYYVATESPEINIDRVSYRVSTGGHPVPEEKIRTRYARSLDLLFDAVIRSNRAYIFDNSGAERVWIAEITDGQELIMRTDVMPVWFQKALWDKFEATI